MSYATLHYSLCVTGGCECHRSFCCSSLTLCYGLHLTLVVVNRPSVSKHKKKKDSDTAPLDTLCKCHMYKKTLSGRKGIKVIKLDFKKWTWAQHLLFSFLALKFVPSGACRQKIKEQNCTFDSQHCGEPHTIFFFLLTGPAEAGENPPTTRGNRFTHVTAM